MLAFVLALLLAEVSTGAPGWPAVFIALISGGGLVAGLFKYLQSRDAGRLSLERQRAAAELKLREKELENDAKKDLAALAVLQQQVEGLLARVKEIEAKYDALRHERHELAQEANGLRVENAVLTRDVAALNGRVEGLTRENQELTRRVEALTPKGVPVPTFQP